MPELVLPRYYLTRATPDGGKVLLYPLAAIEGAAPERYRGTATEPGDGPHSRRGWTFEVEPRTAAWQFAGAWLVSSEPVEAISRTRPGPRVPDGWMLREEPLALSDEPVSPDLIAAFEDMPEQPDAEQAAHYLEHDAPHVCWQCRVFGASYTVRWAAGAEVAERQPLTLDGWRELPGGPDPDPERTWTVTEPGYVELFGEHTGHLWPGKLSGLRQAVLDALRAHPYVTEVRDWSHDPKVSFTVRIPFEPRRTAERRVKETPRSRTRMRTVVDDVWAIEQHHRDIRLPDLLVGSSKAEALAKWDAAVRAQVEQYVPFDGTEAACGHCHGTGQVHRA